LEHRPLTDREIVESCCLNMVETYFALAKSAQGACRFEDEGIIGCRSESDHPAANFSIIARPNLPAITRLASSASGTSYVVPTDQTGSVLEMMRGAGFVAGPALSLMFLRNPSGGVDLDLETVTGFSARYEHTMFLANQFFSTAGDSFCEGISSMTALADQCELLRLPGRVGPSAGAMLCQTGAVLGLYNISVAPEIRGKGLGANLVRSLVGIAASRKCTATLQCNDSLVPWYERLGFRKYGEVVMMRK
jgi:ribosomal protein S18 acetylase RimI-like enzyme